MKAKMKGWIESMMKDPAGGDVQVKLRLDGSVEEAKSPKVESLKYGADPPRHDLYGGRLNMKVGEVGARFRADPHHGGSDGCGTVTCQECCAMMERIRMLEGALEDAIGAIEHADHPVASKWLPSLQQKLDPPYTDLALMIVDEPVAGVALTLEEMPLLRAVETAGFRVGRGLHTRKPMLICKECERDSGFHFSSCSKALLVEEKRKREPVTHDLKCWPEHFVNLANGDKTFELRRDDRGYEVGDKLHIREWDPGTKDYTGKMLDLRVTHLLRGGQFEQFGLSEGHVLMSVVPV